MTLDEVLPRVLPFGWTKLTPLSFEGQTIQPFVYRDGLKVLASVERQFPDKSVWYHISFSYPNKLPNWNDLRAVKHLFMGKDKLAIQILPREDLPDEYTNFHPNCLHLYRRLDGDTLPGLAPGDRTIT